MLAHLCLHCTQGSEQSPLCFSSDFKTIQKHTVQCAPSRVLISVLHTSLHTGQPAPMCFNMVDSVFEVSAHIGQYRYLLHCIVALLLAQWVSALPLRLMLDNVTYPLLLLL
jgi:hypothetical protein